MYDCYEIINCNCYRSAIVDECEDIICWCDEITDIQKQEMLEEHPEWHISCICN